MKKISKRNIKTAVSSFLISLVIYLVASFMIVMLVYEGIFARVEEYEYHSYLCYEDMVDYNCREVSFDSGNFKINGRIYGDNKDKLVILCHSKGGSGEDMLAEVQFFVDNGYSAMVFDYSGCGKSEGTSQIGLRQPAYILENALSYAKKQGYADMYLYGMGVGGYSAGICSGYEGVKAVAAISSFNSISEITLEYATENMSVLGYLEYPVMMLYQYMVFGADIGDDFVSAVNDSGVPVMVINGTKDETILYDGAALIDSADKITNPYAAFVTVENGLHHSLMRSGNANTLLDKFNDEAYGLYNTYGGSVPVSEIESLYNSYSREDMSELNTELMNGILELFNSAE